VQRETRNVYWYICKKAKKGEDGRGKLVKAKRGGKGTFRPKRNDNTTSFIKLFYLTPIIRMS
jgi:hypothetical protein